MNSLYKSFSNFTNLLKPSIFLSGQIIRGKKVKSGGSATNRRRTTPGKHRRLYVEDGEWVQSDHLLVRQLGLQFYPGENVIFCENHTLKSRFSGHVLITLEKLQPYPDSPLYEYVNAGNVVERKFIHVIAPPKQGSYELIENI